MSTQADRQVIADALSTVSGVDGHPSRPPVLEQGTAWPQWANSSRYGACALLDRWWVWLVVAAGDEQSISEYADAMTVPVWNALDEVTQVELVEPLALETDPSGTQAVPVLRYTVSTTRGAVA
jgi:hypothetical protein